MESYWVEWHTLFNTEIVGDGTNMRELVMNVRLIFRLKICCVSGPTPDPAKYSRLYEIFLIFSQFFFTIFTRFSYINVRTLPTFSNFDLFLPFSNVFCKLKINVRQLHFWDSTASFLSIFSKNIFTMK